MSIGLFQSLVGTLKTNYCPRIPVVWGLVSIPRRYAKNPAGKAEPANDFKVSIPRRYAKNTPGLPTSRFSPEFQSLVGTLKTASPGTGTLTQLGFNPS